MYREYKGIEETDRRSLKNLKLYISDLSWNPYCNEVMLGTNLAMWTSPLLKLCVLAHGKEDRLNLLAMLLVLYQQMCKK